MITFVNPWGLLALLAVPVIVTIHLFRRRYPVREIAGLFLWTGNTRMLDAGRVRDRLPLTTSLLLEILAAMLLALILAQPRFSAGRRPHLVVVLDDSASMSATLASGGTVRERAIEGIEGRAAELGRRTVLTVIATGRRPALIAGPLASWEQTREQLDNWRPMAPHHDPTSAWDLGLQLAGEEARLLFVTDAGLEEPPAGPGRMEIAALGEASGNLAIASARWDVDFSAGTGQVLGHVSNLSNANVTAQISGTRGGERQFVQTMRIPGGATRAFEADVAMGLGEISLHLGSADGQNAADDRLAIDNVATLIEPRSREVRVANALKAEHPAREPLERALAAVPGVELAETGEADLIVTSHTARPPISADGWWLAIGANRSAADDPAVADDFEPVVIDTSSPLLRGVTFDGVTTPSTAAAGFVGTPLAARGETPLLVRRTDTPMRAYGLNIDFGASNFAKSPDWPILISNLIALIREELPGLGRWNYRIGESVALRMPRSSLSGEQPLVLEGPSGSRMIARVRDLVISPPNRPGVYRLYDGRLRNGEAEIAEFAVNFHDGRESDLRDRSSGTRAARVGSGELGAALDSLHSWPISVAMLVILMGLLGNWYLLSKGSFGVRRRVGGSRAGNQSGAL